MTDTQAGTGADIQAFIFDMDGVLADTMEFHYLAWKQLADDIGIPFTREDNDQLRGVAYPDSLYRLLGRDDLPLAEADELVARRDTYYRSYFPQFQPVAGAEAFVQAARAAGLKLGVASSSRHAPGILRQLELDGYFAAVGDGYTVSRSKPAPDLFVWVAGRLDVLPQHCVVFEDGASGIQAARTAGMYAVGIGSGARVNAAHWVLGEDFAQASVGDVLGALSRVERG